ncbi:helix-turn-helix transcriptional regulator [Dongshaea marina]|uniref:helix-turn-helix transcriptional regulator n=1 Tax=Dongshaea marina TaxID=2047966 RepID=UPI00131EDE4D|nr:LuxR family transcriptional regulator [Dongshaea marina]
MTMDELLHLCAKTDSLDELNHLFRRYYRQAGIYHFAFTYYTGIPSSRRKLKYDYATDPIRPWHQHYLLSEYCDFDQTLQESKTIQTPVHWDILTQLKNSCRQKEKKIREESYDFGIRRGINIPLHGAEDDFASLTLYELETTQWINSPSLSLSELFISAYHYYSEIKKHLHRSGFKCTPTLLTERECICLELTRQNKSVDAISVLLNISQRTVNFHLQNANKKLGVKNKYLAVYKATEQGLLLPGTV